MAEEVNANEAITVVSKPSNEIEIDIIEERNKEAYRDTMNIDIKNINTIEKSHKPYTKLWRKI